MAVFQIEKAPWYHMYTGRELEKSRAGAGKRLLLTVSLLQTEAAGHEAEPKRFAVSPSGKLPVLCPFLPPKSWRNHPPKVTFPFILKT